MAEVTRRGFLGAAALTVPCCMFCRRALAEDAKEAPKPEYKLVAPCGIYCGACDGLMKSLYAKEPTKEGCRGCLSDQVPEWSCKQCQVRPCAMKKKLESCALCPEYPACGKLKVVLKWSKTEGNLARIKEKGLEEFTKETKATWSCPKCGASFGGKDKKCRKCGEAVKVPQ
jgi:ribosomal protein L40E